MTQSKSKRVVVKCERCGAESLLYPSQIANGQGRYCSRACKNSPRPLSPHPTLPNVLIVPLTKAKAALVSAVDGERVGAFTWSAAFTGRRWYARRMELPTRKHIYLHRFVINAPSDLDADHINGDGLDCRRENLRACSRAENLMNRSVQRNSKSGYKGVTWVKANGKWRASLGVDGRSRLVGWFESADEAARAYDAEAESVYGEFAQLNFPRR